MSTRIAAGNAAQATTSSPGSVMILTLMAVVVLTVLGYTILTFSYSEDFNARRERSSLLALYAAEGGIHEALVRMNLNPSGTNNDETEMTWDTATNRPQNPPSVRDPRMIKGDAPDSGPADYSDSSLPDTSPNKWRFWNYDPNWRYSVASPTDGSGNYPDATSTRQGNLGSAGRGFTYDGSSTRTLVSGSGYDVRVVPHIKRISGTWRFVDQRGNVAATNNYYYRITSVGTFGTQTSMAQVIAKKYNFGLSIPAALTANGDVKVGGNATVSKGDDSTGVAIQSAGAVTGSGSGTVDGLTVDHTAFPAFDTVFGVTKSDLKASATITATYTSDATNPTEVPSGTAGAIIWITAKDSGGAKEKATFTGSGADGYQIGTPENPVILVVNGDLTLNSVTVYGVVYVTGTFRNQGTSQSQGAILVEGTAEADLLGTGSTKIAYSKSVLSNLNGNSQMFPFRALTGTWKMTRG